MSNAISPMGWSKPAILLCPEDYWTKAMVRSSPMGRSCSCAYELHREIPTEPAQSVPTPDPTPQPRGDPFERPDASNPSHGSDRGFDEGTDRSLLSVS